jgi:predicted esterase
VGVVVNVKIGAGAFGYNRVVHTKGLPPLLTYLGILLAAGATLLAASLNRPLWGGQPVTFASPAGDRLAGTYHPGAQPAGVLLLEGFGSDQVTMTALAGEFARSGWHVFTFDFSGHGRSPGALTFDNAQTDRLARQTGAALAEFARLSGLRPEQIFLAGHSLGARVALQSAMISPERVAGLALLGAQVNLAANTQAEFFTGVSDAGLPWVQRLGPQSPDVPILLVSGDWDDILTPANARLLFNQLTGGSVAPQAGLLDSTSVSTSLPRRGQHILPGLVHNYEPFSPRVIAIVNGWMEQTAGVPLAESPAPAIRLWAWAAGLAGLFLALIAGQRWATEVWPGGTAPGLSLRNPRRFLLAKLFLWLAALPAAAMLGSIFFFIPLGKPVFNLIYVGFIGGYGLLLWLVYWRGWMPGLQGRLWAAAERPGEAGSWLATLGITAGMLILSAAYARTGWYFVFPVNVRLAWLAIFTPFTALGFWIGLLEARLQPQTPARQAVLTLIGLFPFFVYTLLMAAIGSLSGMIGGLQGLVILALVLAFGSLVQTVGRRAGLTAVCMAVMLYWLILPQGVLF